MGADGHLRNAHKKYLMTSRVSSRHRYGRETTCFMVRCYAPFCGKCTTASITFTACGAAIWTTTHSLHNQNRGTGMRTISPSTPKCLPLDSWTTSMVCSRTSGAGPSMAEHCHTCYCITGLIVSTSPGNFHNCNPETSCAVTRFCAVGRAWCAASSLCLRICKKAADTLRSLSKGGKRAVPARPDLTLA